MKTLKENFAATLTAVVSITLLIVLLVNIVLNNNIILRFDKACFDLLTTNRIPFFNYVFVLLSYLGGTKIIILLCIFLLLLPNRKKIGIPLSIVTSISAAINFCLKLAISRQRPLGFFLGNPPFNYQFPTSFSFPSGHAQTASVFFIFFGVLICKNYISKKSQKVLVMIVSFLLAFLIGVGRVYLGVHFASDIVGGWLIAAIVICCSMIFAKMCLKKNAYQ